MTEENNNSAPDLDAESQQPAPDAAPQQPVPDAESQQSAPSVVPQQPAQNAPSSDGVPPAAVPPAAPYVPSPGPVPPPAAPPQQPFASGQPADPYGQPAPASYQPAPSNGKAIGALVCGILAIVFAASIIPGIVLGIVAIVLAGKALKESGKDGKATGGRICGIAGIVLSVIALFIYIALGIGLVVWAVNHDNVTVTDHSFSAVSSSPQVTDEEAPAQEAATTQLDKLANKDAATVQYLAAAYDKLFKEQTDYTLSDLGVDSTEFAQWLLGDFNYDSVNVTTYSDGTGSANASVTVRDVSAFLTTFTTEIQSLLDSGAGSSMDMATAKVKVGEIFKGAMATTTDTAEKFATFDLVKKGGTWSVDDDSWESELDYLFGLY